MTQPVPALAPEPVPGALRPVEHLELSEILTHFCGRARPPGGDVPQDIRLMSAADRLASILWMETLRTFVTYSGGDPAACFSEARKPGVEFMIRQRGYQPWGLLFHRQDVYDAGGGPVWHARPEQHDALRQQSQLRAWAVRLEAGSSDWLEEREWRIVRHQGVPLTELRPAGLLVGDPTWTGARWAQLVNAAGQLAWAYYYPPLARGLPRYCWDPATAQLQPLPALPAAS
jgi:hypothetical protein